jgi:hypothetical protein
VEAAQSVQRGNRVGISPLRGRSRSPFLPPSNAFRLRLMSYRRRSDPGASADSLLRRSGHERHEDGPMHRRPLRHDGRQSPPARWTLACRPAGSPQTRNIGRTRSSARSWTSGAGGLRPDAGRPPRSSTPERQRVRFHIGLPRQHPHR